MAPVYAPPTDPAQVSLAAVAADLRQVLASAEPRLRSIPADVAARPLVPGKWSTQQTLGHLVDSALNNQGRLIRLQLTPELHLPGYAQDRWVALGHYHLLPWSTVLDLWLTLNNHLAHTVEHADPSALPNIWVNDAERTTLAFMLVDYVAHLRYHLDRLPLPA